MPDFGSRLAAVLSDRGPLCLGIDAHPFLLAQWGLDDSPAGAREFGLAAVEAAAGRVGVVKPQVAFFERHGSAGYSALEDVLAAARESGLLVIADAKRGDIGSTVEAYGQAWLTPGSPLEADALTVVAYQGVGSLGEPLALAREHGKGLFVLAATSNPEAVATQTAVRFSGTTVAAGVVDEVAALTRGSALGSIGVVIGATVALDDYGVSPESLERIPVLAPGFGEQGARLSDLGRLFGSASGGVVANVGRGILRAGRAGLADALSAAAAEARAAA